VLASICQIFFKKCIGARTCFEPNVLWIEEQFTDGTICRENWREQENAGTLPVDRREAPFLNGRFHQ